MTWELRLGNCLDPVTGLASLPDKSVDHVITDPPYSDHTHAKQWVSAALTEEGLPRASSNWSSLGFDCMTPDIARAVAMQFSRVVKRWVLIFSDLEGIALWRSVLVDAGLEYVRTCIWDKVDGAPQFTGDRPAVGAEAIVIAHQPGRKRWNGGGRHGVWEFPIVLKRGDRDERRVHTTQKPLALMSALVADFTDPGDLILDPFAGSGTTGVAAIRAGRRFVGWEQDPKYHAIAARRLADTRTQGELPFGRTARAVQESLL